MRCPPSDSRSIACPAAGRHTAPGREISWKSCHASSATTSFAAQPAAARPGSLRHWKQQAPTSSISKAWPITPAPYSAPSPPSPRHIGKACPQFDKATKLDLLRLARPGLLKVARDGNKEPVAVQ